MEKLARVLTMANKFLDAYVKFLFSTIAFAICAFLIYHAALNNIAIIKQKDRMCYVYKPRNTVNPNDNADKRGKDQSGKVTQR